MKVTKTQQQLVAMWNAVNELLADEEKGGVFFLLTLAEIKMALKPVVEKLETVQKTFAGELDARRRKLDKKASELSRKDSKGNAVRFENGGYAIPVENVDQLEEFTTKLDEEYKDSLTLEKGYSESLMATEETLELPQIARKLLPPKMKGYQAEALFDLIHTAKAEEVQEDKGEPE